METAKLVPHDMAGSIATADAGAMVELSQGCGENLTPECESQPEGPLDDGRHSPSPHVK